MFPQAVRFSAMLRDELQKELERVTRERHQLADQLREDALLLDAKLSAAKQQGRSSSAVLGMSNVTAHCACRGKKWSQAVSMATFYNVRRAAMAFVTPSEMRPNSPSPRLYLLSAVIFSSDKSAENLMS